MSDDGIMILIGLVLAIHGVLAGLLANSKGYNPVGAFLNPKKHCETIK